MGLLIARTFVTSEQAIALAFTNYTGTLHFHTTFGQLQDRTLSTSGPLRPTSGPLHVHFQSRLAFNAFQCISGPLPIHFWSNLDLLPVHLQPTFNSFPVNGFKKFYELKSEMSCPFNSGVFVTV